MKDSKTNESSMNHWSSRFFTIAGSFMLVNTAFLWIRYYSDNQLTLLWAAIPSIIGLTSSVIGLLKLYPRISSFAPKTAKSGAAFGLVACASLGIATVWIFVVSVFGEGISGGPSQGLLMLIAIFMVAMILAFFSNAIGFLRHSAQRSIGYLLSVPLAMWLLMMVIGAVQGMEVGLSLDYYTNGVIAVAFLALGFTLKTNKDVAS